MFIQGMIFGFNLTRLELIIHSRRTNLVQNVANSFRRHWFSDSRAATRWRRDSNSVGRVLGYMAQTGKQIATRNATKSTLTITKTDNTRSNHRPSSLHAKTLRTTTNSIKDTTKTLRNTAITKIEILRNHTNRLLPLNDLEVMCKR